MTHKHNNYSRKFIITSELVKSFEVDSSDTCHCQVKSSQVECDQVDGGRLGVNLSLKSGHDPVSQRLTGLVVVV